MDVFRVRKIRDVPSGMTSGGTLDSMHQEIVQGLKDSTLIQDKLKQELEELRAKNSELCARNDVGAAVEATHVQTRIREIEIELEHTNPLQEYYMKNMDLLMDYYKKQEAPSVSHPAGRDTNNTFMKFFSQAIPESTGPTRKQVFDEYVQRMRLAPSVDAIQTLTEHCSICNVAREEISSEGILVCPRCGSEEYALVVSDFPSFRDPPKERNNYAYKKINHLNEILNQFQAKESTIIPEDVMNEVILESRKQMFDEYVQRMKLSSGPEAGQLIT